MAKIGLGIGHWISVIRILNLFEICCLGFGISAKPAFSRLGKR